MTRTPRLPAALPLLLATALLAACGNSDTPPETAPTTGTPPAADPQLALVKLPPGFRIDYYARNLPDARSLTRGDRGTIFVGSREESAVYALVDRDNDGRADTTYRVLTNIDGRRLQSPNGVAFRNGALYVAEISRIWRLDDIENRLANPPKPVLVTEDYPTDTHHGWKYIAFGPDGKLYVPVGAPCNTCDKRDENPVYASITRINPDGTGREIFAHGVRNTVGFTWHPETQEMWFTDNGRDMLGDNLPGCELNHAPRPGMDFGYPYIHQGNLPDPEFGQGKNAVAYTPPVQVLGPHVAPLGLKFYTGQMFPAEFRNNLLIAEHGSWNRSTPIGYRVMRVRLDAAGKSLGYEVFAEGWLQGSRAWGRPVDVLVMPDGAVLVSDDRNDCVYRIHYAG